MQSFPDLDTPLLAVPEFIWRPGWRRRTYRSGTPGRWWSRPCWACVCTPTAGTLGLLSESACWGRRAEPWPDLVCFQTAWPPPAGRLRLQGQIDTSCGELPLQVCVCACSSKSHLVCTCRRPSSAASHTSLRSSHEWFYPECTDQQEEAHRWRNLLCATGSYVIAADGALRSHMKLKMLTSCRSFYLGGLIKNTYVPEDTHQLGMWCYHHPEQNVSAPFLPHAADRTLWPRRKGTPSPPHGPEPQCSLGVIQQCTWKLMDKRLIVVWRKNKVELVRDLTSEIHNVLEAGEVKSCRDVVSVQNPRGVHQTHELHHLLLWSEMWLKIMTEVTRWTEPTQQTHTCKWPGKSPLLEDQKSFHSGSSPPCMDREHKTI